MMLGPLVDSSTLVGTSNSISRNSAGAYLFNETLLFPAAATDRSPAIPRFTRDVPSCREKNSRAIALNEAEAAAFDGSRFCLRFFFSE
jgi:hypothetical protein